MSLMSLEPWAELYIMPLHPHHPKTNLFAEFYQDQRTPGINPPIVPPPSSIMVLRSLRSRRAGSFKRPRIPESNITAPTPRAETMLQPERHLPGGAGQLESLQQPHESPEGCTFLPSTGRSRERICPNLGRVLQRMIAVQTFVDYAPFSR